MSTIIKPTFKFYKLPHAKHLPLPYKATKGSAGYDVHASMMRAVDSRVREEGFVLRHGQILRVSTGLCSDIPQGWEIQIRPRSGLASNCGVTVLNAPATIDSDYTGEICVLLINHGYEDCIIRDGDRIAQFVFAPVYDVNVESVDVIEKQTHRGDNGFGSTGNTSAGLEVQENEKHGYYDVGGLSTLDILQAKLSDEEYRGFLLGNVFKYLSRHKHKGSKYNDILKAEEYLRWYREELAREVH